MNPALKALGYGPRDRVLIIHADDIGMCQATLPAIADLMEFGVTSSAAVMVPCPWFPQAAAFCREHPEVDMGVHLTVNCEWEAYRWGALSTTDPASGLLDEDGYFHCWPSATWEHADLSVVATEMRVQVERGLRAGIDPTHLDTHMGTVVRPPFLQAYIDLALEHRLPVFLPRHYKERLMSRGDDPELAAQGARSTEELELRGVPLFDAIAMLPLDDSSDHVGVMRKVIDDLQPGLTMLIFHPACDTTELRALAPDWPSRVANYKALISPEVRGHIRASGVEVIGYRPLRDLLRSAS